MDEGSHLEGRIVIVVPEFFVALLLPRERTVSVVLVFGSFGPFSGPFRQRLQEAGVQVFRDAPIVDLDKGFRGTVRRKRRGNAAIFGSLGGHTGFLFVFVFVFSISFRFGFRFGFRFVVVFSVAGILFGLGFWVELPLLLSVRQFHRGSTNGGLVF